MTYKLYLDDYRPCPNGWVLVKNYREFCDYITQNGIPLIVSFDHDLADIHYGHIDNVIPYKEFESRGQTEYTGYHCALWLVKYCEENELEFPYWEVHSMNPVGKQNIINLLRPNRK